MFVIKKSEILKRNVFLLFVLLNSPVVLSQNRITGIVKDSNLEVLAGVIVCQGNSENCTITDLNGSFQLVPDKKKGSTLNFSFPGYKSVSINFIDTIKTDLIIQMDIDDSVLLIYPDKGPFITDPSLKGWGFVASLQFDMIINRFGEFSSLLGNDNIELMNNLNVVSGWELSASYNRYQAGIIYGFSDAGKYDHDSLVMKTNTALYGLSFGFKIIDGKRFVITPKIAAKWYRYRLVNYDKDRKISLNQYLLDRDLDLRFNQITGFFGASLAYKLYIDNFIFSSDYWTIGFYGGYIFKLNDNPWIYSKHNRLIDDNKIRMNNLNVGVSMSFVID
ncbi:MAG TPA: hypothetical protein DDW27_20260 [Bacteroidales bacterium]|nr:hypothetical protein [Bacteroidales bacterium]